MLRTLKRWQRRRMLYQGRSCEEPESVNDNGKDSEDADTKVEVQESQNVEGAAIDSEESPDTQTLIAMPSQKMPQRKYPNLPRQLNR
jgi:hypothetical protein